MPGRLLADLETHLQRYEVSLRPGSQALGGGLGLVRRQVADRFLERNQALRTAALEAHHITMILDFLAHVARTRDDQTRSSSANAGTRRRRQSPKTRPARRGT